MDVFGCWVCEEDEKVKTMDNTVRVYQSKPGCYIAEYTTLDIVSQGDTKEKALLALLDCITAQIDYGIENDNTENLFK